MYFFLLLLLYLQFFLQSFLLHLKIVYVPFAKAIKHDKGIDRGALELVKILSI